MRRLLLVALLAIMALALYRVAWAQEAPASGPSGPARTEEAAEPGGGHAEEPDALLFWRWANFVLLAMGLGYLIMKAVPPAFAARTSNIQKGIAEARAYKAKADQRAAQIEARMTSLGTEIENLRAQSKSEMQQEGERIRQETAASLRKLEEQSRLEIESAAKLAQSELKHYAAELALDLAEQRIRARMDGATEAALIERFAHDLNGRGSQH
jgi:F-type H+-transporting ATPase subunit b